VATALRLGTAAENSALERVATGASHVASISRVVAFGSRVRGDFAADSDLDLLVLVDSIVAREEVIRFLYDIDADTGVSLSPVIYTAREFAVNLALGSGFVANVEREGVVLYDAQRRGEGRSGGLPVRKGHGTAG
jgi:predicted nucleotidyltransferase